MLPLRIVEALDVVEDIRLGLVAQGAAENMGILCIGLAGLSGGAWTIMGRNWARWLVAAWIALHVALGATDTPMLAAHAAIFIVVVVGLFNPATSRYFRIP